MFALMITQPKYKSSVEDDNFQYLKAMQEFSNQKPVL